MILRNRNTGQFELYNISNNAIASSSNLGTVGLNFQVARFGDFNADATTDMTLRNTSSGQFELYDITNNQITSVFNIGTVGLDFQVAGFADFNQDGTTDMMLRNKNTGSFSIYDIKNNAIVAASSPARSDRTFRSRASGHFTRPAHPTRSCATPIPASSRSTTSSTIRHDGQQLGHGRLGLVGRRLRRRSAQRQFNSEVSTGASDGWVRRRCGRQLQYRSSRCRHVTADVSDGPTARLSA
jgi:hypothetical protein